jgi:hypothetical protein
MNRRLTKTKPKEISITANQLVAFTCLLEQLGRYMIMDVTSIVANPVRRKEEYDNLKRFVDKCKKTLKTIDVSKLAAIDGAEFFGSVNGDKLTVNATGKIGSVSDGQLLIVNGDPYLIIGIGPTYTLKNTLKNAVSKNVSNVKLYSVNPYSYYDYEQIDVYAQIGNPNVFASSHPLFAGVSFNGTYQENRGTMRRLIVQYIEGVRKIIVEYLARCKIK